MKKIFYLLMVSIIFYSCGNFQDKEKRGNSDIIINLENFYSMIPSYSEADIFLNNQLYEGLIRIDENNEVAPGLAEKYEVSPDGKIFKFYLRKNLKFSDGTPIKSENFIMKFANNKNEKKIYSNDFIKATAVNDETIQIERLVRNVQLEKETEKKEFLRLFSKLNTMPRKEDYPFYPELGYNYVEISVEKVISTGPYVLKEWGKDRKIIEKNPYYWNKDNVKTEKIIFKHVKDLSSSLKQFKSGETDFTLIKEENIEEYKEKPELKTIETRYSTILKFNNRNSIMENPQIRKAILMALKREESLPKNYSKMNRYFKDEELKQKVHDTIPGYSPSKAKKIIEQFNIKSSPALIFLSYNTENKKKALAIKNELEKNLGLKIKIIFKPDKKYARDYDFSLEDVEIGKKYEKNNLIDQFNLEEATSIRNLYDKIEKSKDSTEKLNLMNEIENMYVEKLPFILINDKVYRYFLINPKLKGFEVLPPYGELTLNYTYIEK